MSAAESATATRTRLSIGFVYDQGGTLEAPDGSPVRPHPVFCRTSRRFGEARKISVDLAQIDRLRGIRRRRRSDARRRFGGADAVETEVLRDPLDHGVIDAGSARDVPFEERVVAQRVDEARRTA